MRVVLIRLLWLMVDICLLTNALESVCCMEIAQPPPILGHPNPQPLEESSDCLGSRRHVAARVRTARYSRLAAASLFRSSSRTAFPALTSASVSSWSPQNPHM